MKNVRQNGKRQSIPVVLEVEQFQRLFGASPAKRTDHGVAWIAAAACVVVS
jgi:hypothetical protein